VHDSDKRVSTAQDAKYMTTDFETIRKLFRDLVLVSEKCKRDINAKTTLGARPYMHEFNRILEMLRPHIPSLEDIKSIKKPQDEKEADFSYFYLEVLYEIDLSLDKAITRIREQFPNLNQDQTIPKRLKAFVSHGRESEALFKIQKFLRNLSVDPILVKDQPSLDKTLTDKVSYYLLQADFVVVLATGDDEVKGTKHPKQNVIHEIGLAQNTHAGKIIYLLETGTEFPSNIDPKVWERFNQTNIENVFERMVLELTAMGMLSTRSA